MTTTLQRLRKGVLTVGELQAILAHVEPLATVRIVGPDSDLTDVSEIAVTLLRGGATVDIY